MNNQHVISNDLAEVIESEITNGYHWQAYNTMSYFLEREDMFFFKNETEARSFADNNISEYDVFHVITAKSLTDVMRQIPYGDVFNYCIQSEFSITDQTTQTMNQKNLEYLTDQVKFTGFGDTLAPELKEHIQKQPDEFQIPFKTQFNNSDVLAVLHFGKSKETDMYFFNRYDVSLTSQQSNEAISHTFYINKGSNITLKEAFNLMNGRSVNKDLTSKEGQVYNAWVQIDFKQADENGAYKMKQYHQNYGYDVNEALAKHPIKELSNERDKSRLIDSLQKGNLQSVSFIQGGTEQKHFIEANPQFKTINIYDRNNQRISHRQGQTEIQDGTGEQNTAKQNTKNENKKQADADEGDAAPKASQARKKKNGQKV